MKGDLLGNRLLGLKGLLSQVHPYHRHAEVTHFLAWRGKKLAGRISAAVNRRFNEHYNARIGSFGFFEVADDYDAAAALLDAARQWLTARGMDSMRGPGEYSNATHERQGILVDGFEHPPTIELTHNPPYYAAFMERYGLNKVKDYHAYLMDIKAPAPDRLAVLADKVRKRRDIETRPLILNRLNEEVRLITSIYNQAWAKNWGFLPITDEEAQILADSLRIVVDPDMIRFAFVGGKPAAVLGALPDPNQALRPRWQWYGDHDFLRVARLWWMRRRIPFVRLMFFGICPEYRKLGIDALLYDEVKNYAVSRGYTRCEASLLLEDNHLVLSPSEFMGARRYKTWRIYELPLR